MDERLFFALWPTPQVRAELDALAHAAAARAEARVTRAETLHLTLVFIGACDPARHARLEADAAGCAGGSFDITFDRLGSWSRNGIVWLAPSAIPPELQEVQERLAAITRALGFKLDARPYSPHITLARKAQRFLPPEKVEPLRMRAQAFTLVRSELTREGPRYVSLKSWPLRAGVD
jgi:2'-5' RNA ligase